MKLAVLTPSVTALPQPTVEDIGKLSAMGYRSVISNRPDGEAADQPDFAQIARAAAEHGMEALHIPVSLGQLDDSQVTAFRHALGRLPRPIAAFCRSGTRAALMWALANEANLTVNERLSIAGQEGFDLEPFRALMEKGLSDGDA